VVQAGAPERLIEGGLPTEAMVSRPGNDLTRRFVVSGNAENHAAFAAPLFDRIATT
jgi:hypothetical protein